MAQPFIQASFNSGEWSPNLYARVDIEKFHSGAALLRNFFVDYRGGASTRTGTQYVIRAYKDSTAVRLIPFQATFTVGYALEFGDAYIRFHRNGAPVLESGLNITGASNTNPCVLTVTNTYTTGDVDWVYISGVGGMTQLNGKYFIVHARTSGTVTLYDLFGNPVDATGYGVFTTGGTTQRVYTIASPYAAADLALVKYAQNVSDLILCHPNYPPQVLTYTSPTSWSINAIVFGSTISAPTGLGHSTTLIDGDTFYGYVVTAIDKNGQESGPSAVETFHADNMALVQGTNLITWSGVTNAVSYNVYKANSTYLTGIPAGVPYGFIGNTTNTEISDTNIAPNFAISPPTPQNPFATGSGVLAVNITTAGSYTTAPTVSFAAPGGGGVTATGTPVLTANTVTLQAAGTGYKVGDLVVLQGNTIIQVATLSGSAIATFTVINGGAISGALPSTPVPQQSTSGTGSGATFNLTWKVLSVTITDPGSTYSAAPAVTFSAGTAAGTAVLGPTGVGNPSVPAFFQQRLVLAAPISAPQTIYFSQPGAYYNFDTSTPTQDDDAITASIISGQLNSIKSMIAQPAGLIVLTDGSSWLINGGSFGAAITPAAIVANAQSFNGANDVPPIIVVYDMLYVQSKGSSVRDSLYNFYANVYTGTDISILPSHLFYGFHVTEWAWAEEPFKLVYAVRNDGTMLTLTFLKEQEFAGWAHSDTDGAFASVATIIEQVGSNSLNAVYTVVERTINGMAVKYVERFADRYLTAGVVDAWTVDCGLQYSGAPATSFSGGEFLVGKTCTGLADGVIIPSFVMPASGNFTLATPASKVTIGIAFTPQLKTLPIDIGNPTIQSKMKKIPEVTIRVAQTLGLQIGTTFDNLVDMKDLVRGNVGAMTNEVVTDLVTGDAMTKLDPKWQEIGQICVQQTYPYPASILGVIPELMVGDTAK